MMERIVSVQLPQDVVNKIFTFLLHLQKEAVPMTQDGLYPPLDWDAAEIDPQVKSFWDQARKRENRK